MTFYLVMGVSTLLTVLGFIYQWKKLRLFEKSLTPSDDKLLRLEDIIKDMREDIHDAASTHSKIVNLESDLGAVYSLLKQTPMNILNTIRGANNKLQGEFGEYAASLAIKSQYDKIINLGDICDFIGIQFPREGSRGKIHFIEVKTGGASLSKEQILFKKLVTEAQTDPTGPEILFVTYKIALEKLTRKDINEGED